ncbi:SDR family oxidoreductase [Nonomuraea sp. NPDC050310]|uniref:SDR family oxidoreductase n=1 Tax=Nonomuraea sp. NPDC050310 TaxID=3154935 RepID=UPI0033DDB69D
MEEVLVTGATGRVGRHVAQTLAQAGLPVRRATTSPRESSDVRFSFTDPTTFHDAFRGVDRMFLMRPPQIGNVRRDMFPAMDAARRMGVRRVVLLSLQGAERNPVVPHHRLESWLRASGQEWTFVRAGFFLQNLSMTHAREIREDGVIMVPAGRGRTSFVDARDVAGVAALALREDGHADRAYIPTGARALTYAEVARTLTDVVGKPIHYGDPGPLAYWRHARRHGLPVPMTMTMITLALYSACRFGLAAGVTDDVRRLLGREPISLRRFAEDERAAWL